MAGLQIKAWVTGHMNPEVVDQMLNLVGEANSHALEAINSILAVLDEHDDELASRLKHLFGEKELFTIGLTEPEPATLVEYDGESAAPKTRRDRIAAEREYFEGLPLGEGGTAWGEDNDLCAWVMLAGKRYNFDSGQRTWDDGYISGPSGTYEFRKDDQGADLAGIRLVMLNPDGSVYAAIEHYSQDESLVVANPGSENDAVDISNQ